MIDSQAIDIISIIIIMSLTGGMLALILFALKPVIRRRLSKSVQYYLWIVVLAALLIPVSKLIILPETPSNIPIAPIHNVVRQNIVLAEEQNILPSKNINMNTAQTDNTNTTVQANASVFPEIESALAREFSLTEVILMVYMSIGLIILIYNIFSYIRFTRKVRNHRTRAGKDELYELIGLCGNNNPPRLYRSAFAATPMLIGIFKPEIMLPDREYTETELQSVLQHELTHLRRRDVVVKWLSVIACALHWFNPIVWLMRREIDRTCELACDEAVIRTLDLSGKQSYGDTLISVAADVSTSRAVLSTTMCEEKESLKERLDAIMKYQKRTWIMSVFSVIIVTTAVFAVCILGAGAVPSAKNDAEADMLALASNYSEDDIEAINNIIEKNGLKGYEKSDPKNWGFASWRHNRVLWLELGGKSLKGTLDVSNLTELKGLNCPDNDLTAINVSKNTKLMQIDCGDNPITYLDVHNNINLEWLGCYRNKLEELDITKNINLISLTCHTNSLTALNISQNKKLIYLECSMNKIVSLDLTKNLDLKTLHAHDNQLITLDLTGLNKLKLLQYIDNPLEIFILPDGSRGSNSPSGPVYF